MAAANIPLSRAPLLCGMSPPSGKWKLAGAMLLLLRSILRRAICHLVRRANVVMSVITNENGGVVT